MTSKHGWARWMAHAARVRRKEYNRMIRQLGWRWQCRHMQMRGTIGFAAHMHDTSWGGCMWTCRSSLVLDGSERYICVYLCTRVGVRKARNSLLLLGKPRLRWLCW